MADFFSSATLAATAADPRFPIALAVAAVGGLVRGFAGFGSALICVPLIAAIYGPRAAASSILLIDMLCSLPVAIQVAPQSNWREIVPMSIASIIAVPAGVAALLYIDPLVLRWFIAVLVLIALLALILGWRYRGKPTAAAAGFVGMLSGFGAGAVQIGAPPILVFWLGGQNSAARVRANIMVYFIWLDALSTVLYWWSGLLTPETVSLSILLGAPFALALFAGAYWFHGTSDQLYRRVAYVLIAFAGIVSLPIFDSLR